MSQGGVREQLKRGHAFLRSYAGGVRLSDFSRLFRREAKDAYSVLTRDQEESGPGDDFKRFLQNLRRGFLGLSYKLSPVRRVLFAAAVLLALVGALNLRFEVLSGRLAVTASPGLPLLAVALLVLLLALELGDRVRVRDELEVARALQRELLPEHPPQVPGWRFAASYRTANDIGGDYYDFAELPDGRLAVLAGDASGHGIAAGLLMVIANSTLHLALDTDPRPAAVARLLHRVLTRTGGSRAFMSLFYGLLDPRTGQLEYVCAGHPFPILRRAAGRLEELGRGGFPLGLRREPDLQPERTTLGNGDVLLIYSDGLPEAHHPVRDETFGFERLRRLVYLGGSPRAIQERVLGELGTFMGEERLTDDVSLVVLGRLP
jgi:phosphoserine phosphatase RsbU/P